MFVNEVMPDSTTRQMAKYFRNGLMVSAAAVWLGAASVSTASAGTIVKEWDFNLDNAFVAWTDTDGKDQTMVSGITPSMPNPALTAPSMLSWGTPDNANGLNPGLDQSSLSVGLAPDGNFASPGDGLALKTDIDGSLVPPATTTQAGNEVATVMVTHMNNQITSKDAIGGTPYLATALLLDVLTLMPTVYDVGTPLAGPLTLPSLVIPITFLETLNSPNDSLVAPDAPGNCADILSPAGQGCNDIFVVDVPPGGIFDLADNSINQMFVFDDFAYNAKIRLTGLGLLADKICTAASRASGCIGLTTVENMANNFQAFLSIQLKGEVAEPGTLGVFGLGLVGLGFARRRNRKKMAA